MEKLKVASLVEKYAGLKQANKQTNKQKPVTVLGQTGNKIVSEIDDISWQAWNICLIPLNLYFDDPFKQVTY